MLAAQCDFELAFTQMMPLQICYMGHAGTSGRAHASLPMLAMRKKTRPSRQYSTVSTSSTRLKKDVAKSQLVSTASARATTAAMASAR